MYLEPNNPSLSFANFLDAAIRDKAEIKPFPYTLEVCRCRYCSYCQNGKCALKRCCCIRYNGMYAEQIAKAWIRSEILMPRHLTFTGKNEHYDKKKKEDK